MNEKPNTSAQRVQDFLADRGYELVIRQFPSSTRTALEAAQAIGCDVGQIAKSLIFRSETTGEPVLVVASGRNRVDMNKLTELTGLTLGKANAGFVKQAVGFTIGGVPPVAHLRPVTTFLDQDLKQYSQIWAAAGTPNSVFALDTCHLEEMTQGRWLEIAE